MSERYLSSLIQSVILLFLLFTGNAHSQFSWFESPSFELGLKEFNKKNYKLAAEIFQKTISDPRSVGQLGFMYDQGYYFKQDKKQACMLWRQASEQYENVSIINWWYNCELQNDYAIKAFMFHQLENNDTSPTTSYILSDYLLRFKIKNSGYDQSHSAKYTSEIVSKNGMRDDAPSWFIQMALQYFFGEDAKKDYASSYKWFYLTSTHKNVSNSQQEFSSAMINLITKKLNSQQINSIKTSADQCIKNSYRNCT